MNIRNETTRYVGAGNLDRLAKWANRRPVIALMGEFSAGKSTLLNMLIGRSLLPMQVTATRLPPVWARYGTAPSYRIDQDGRRHDVDLHNPASIPMEETRYIRIYHDSEMLRKCDIIDTPGISDPNIPLGVWIKTIAYANSVLWCTPANQAWRESERGTWETLPQRLREHSLLLVTRADKLLSDVDQDKIDRRLERETSALFGGRHFISLTNALKSLEGEGDPHAWVKSGAQAFMESLANVIEATHLNRQQQLSRYAIGEKIVKAGSGGETKSASGLRPTRIVPGSGGERGAPRISQDDAEHLRGEFSAPVANGDQKDEIAPSEASGGEESKPRSIFSLRKSDKQAGDAAPREAANSDLDDIVKQDASGGDVGFHHHPNPDDAVKVEGEPQAAEDEFHEDDYSQEPGPEEVSNVIARIDAASTDIDGDDPAERPAGDEAAVSEDSPAPRLASEIWRDILADQEIETVAQMKDAVTRLVAELDENAALSGASELARAHG